MPRIHTSSVRQTFDSVRRAFGSLAAAAILVTSLLPPASIARAAPADNSMVLLIQPILSEQETRRAFQPLADYLEQVTGRPLTIATRPNFIAYWDTLRRANGYDLVLDAAHFTDYRVQKLGFRVLAKIPDSVSYTLIVNEDHLVIDPIELTGKTVATLGPPSIGAARLSGMFPNPVRQPIIVEINTSEKAFELLRTGKVQAAILPTPLVSQRMSQGAKISVVTTTEPIPHIAVSSSPRLDAVVRNKIREALVNASRSAEGRKMLKGIGFERFDPATEEIYVNHSRILKEYWGY